MINDGHASSPDGARGEAAGDGKPKLAATILTQATQTATVAALLFYFGYRRTNAFYAHFGVDTTALGMAPQDYILRSVSAITILLFAVVMIAVVALAVAGAPDRAGMYTIVQQLKSRGYHLAVALVLIGLVLDAIVPERANAWSVVIAAAALLGYVTARLKLIPTTGTVDVRTLWLSRILLLGTVVAAFSACSYVAMAVGDNEATSVVANLRDAPDVTLLSTDDLGLSSTDVHPAATTGRYKVKYDGLRLIVVTSDNYVLLGKHWRRGDPVMIVPKGDDVRIDVATTTTS